MYLVVKKNSMERIFRSERAFFLEKSYCCDQSLPCPRTAQLPRRVCIRLHSVSPRTTPQRLLDCKIAPAVQAGTPADRAKAPAASAGTTDPPSRFTVASKIPCSRANRLPAAIARQANPQARHPFLGHAAQNRPSRRPSRLGPETGRTLAIRHQHDHHQALGTKHSHAVATKHAASHSKSRRRRNQLRPVLASCP